MLLCTDRLQGVGSVSMAVCPCQCGMHEVCRHLQVQGRIFKCQYMDNTEVCVYMYKVDNRKISFPRRIAMP